MIGALHGIYVIPAYYQGKSVSNRQLFFSSLYLTLHHL